MPTTIQYSSIGIIRGRGALKFSVVGLWDFVWLFLMLNVEFATRAVFGWYYR